MEKEKLLLEILKVKLLFFSAVVGGSFGYLLKVENYLINILLLSMLTTGVIGVIKSLYGLGEIYKSLKDKK